MLDSHEITKSLPPPREDEPASLRQDIIDEIRDHIECSVRRELLMGSSDEIQAYDRVLKRFGDPHLVARRLWFQAMWSKIMTQRLAIGSLVCSMVVSITMVVMMAVLIGRMDQQQRDQQALNVALIEKMGSLLVPPAAAAPRDPDWSHLQIKLTSGSEDGPPATGVVVDVCRTPRIGENLENPCIEHVHVDSMGFADCGDVTPGNYVADVRTASGEQTRVNFTVKRGVDHLERIVVPLAVTEVADVSVEVEGIKPGPKPKYLLVGQFYSCAREISGRTWSPAEQRSTTYLAIDSNRRPWIAELPAELGMDGMNILSTAACVAKANWKPLVSSMRFSLPANIYRLNFERVELNEDMSFDSLNWQSAIGSDTYEWPSKYNTAEWRWQRFTAKAAEPNHWTIQIPNEALGDEPDSTPIEN